MSEISFAEILKTALKSEVSASETKNNKTSVYTESIHKLIDDLEKLGLSKQHNLNHTNCTHYKKTKSQSSFNTTDNDAHRQNQRVYESLFAHFPSEIRTSLIFFASRIEGFDPNQSHSNLKTHYRKLAFRLHPDRYCHRSESEIHRAKTLFQELHAHYLILKKHFKSA